MSITSPVNSDELRQYIEKIERLEDEKKELHIQIREVLDEAKAQGFDTKIMRMIMRMRKMKKEDLLEEQEILEVYTNALGMKLQLKA
ncbi:MAG: GapR family DNA-binding domain-containing protein [Alphaproteobacteria bacterium]